jgi:hypothetical protein
MTTTYEEYRKGVCPDGCGKDIPLWTNNKHTPEDVLGTDAGLPQLHPNCTALPFGAWAEQTIAELARQLEERSADLKQALAVGIGHMERAEAAEGYLSELSPRYKDIVVERGELQRQNAELLAGLVAYKTYRDSGLGGRASKQAQDARESLHDLVEGLIAKYRGGE